MSDKSYPISTNYPLLSPPLYRERVLIAKRFSFQSKKGLGEVVVKNRFVRQSLFAVKKELDEKWVIDTIVDVLDALSDGR